MIVLGLGTNLGNRLENLNKAVELLKSIITNINISLIYETEALLFASSPTSWNRPYYNMVVSGQTKLQPFDLLTALKKIEMQMGRISHDHQKWSPRIIDIDILLYNDVIIETQALTIPHKEMLNRSFVMLPLYQLHPNLKHPKLNITIEEIIGNFRQYLGSFISCLPFAPKLMGIVNVTPDSFSNGNDKFHHIDTSIEQAMKLVSDGACILDIGAQATNPYATQIPWQLELERLEPVLRALSYELKKNDKHVKISIDSFYPEIFSSLVEKYTIDIMNDVSGFQSDKMIQIANAANMQYVLMHSTHIPADHNKLLAFSDDAILALLTWGHEKIVAIQKLGLDKSKIIFDPGIGFGKSPSQSIYLMKHLDRFKELDVELLVGHSRKYYMNTFSSNIASERDIETAIASTLMHNHIDYLRVHNIEMTRRALAAAIASK